MFRSLMQSPLSVSAGPRRIVDITFSIRAPGAVFYPEEGYSFYFCFRSFAQFAVDGTRRWVRGKGGKSIRREARDAAAAP